MANTLTSTDKVATDKAVKQVTERFKPPKSVKVSGYDVLCKVELHENKKRAVFAYYNDYVPTKFNGDEVACETENIAFIDYGDRIEICNEHGKNEPSDKNIRAGLKLFQKKFPDQMIFIDGDDDFRVRMTEIATKMGVVVANPEMQQLVARLKGEDFEEATEEEAAFSAPGM